jgi:hypothetical protein
MSMLHGFFEMKQNIRHVQGTNALLKYEAPFRTLVDLATDDVKRGLFGDEEGPQEPPNSNTSSEQERQASDPTQICVFAEAGNENPVPAAAVPPASPPRGGAAEEFEVEIVMHDPNEIREPPNLRRRFRTLTAHIPIPIVKRENN